jgi:hypothetical protein
LLSFFKIPDLKKEDFLKHYTGLSNIELLKILEEKEKYQPAAIEIAQQILSERNYSNDEITTAKAEINFVVDKKIVQQEKIKKKIHLINEFIDEHFGIKEKAPRKLLNLFCFALFLYNLISGFFSIKDFTYFFISKASGYIVGILVYLLPLLIIYLLYKRNNWGWALIVAINMILALQTIHSFFIFYKYRDLFLAPSSPYRLLVNLSFYIAVIIFLNSKKIRDQFTITRDGRITTFIITGIFFILMYFILS